MSDLAERCRDYRRIADAIRYLVDHRLDQPDLDEVARSVGLSPYHFHRLFSAWAGVSPKRFLGFLTLAHARAVLQSSASVLDAALDAGLSGPSRLHDLFVSYEAVTPGDVKARGHGLTIRYGIHPSPFGDCLLLATDRGICGLSFLGDGGAEAEMTFARRRWSAARLVDDPQATAPLAEAAFAIRRDRPLALHVVGTNFQVKVWEALMRLPTGALVDYGAVGAAVGRPGAARAIGNAMAANPIGYLIPCHRVIRATGVFHGYRWGDERRRAIIGWEAAQVFGEDDGQSAA